MKICVNWKTLLARLNMTLSDFVKLKDWRRACRTKWLCFLLLRHNKKTRICWFHYQWKIERKHWKYSSLLWSCRSSNSQNKQKCTVWHCSSLRSNIKSSRIWNGKILQWCRSCSKINLWMSLEIVMGDWNSKVGVRSTHGNDVLGPHGYGIRNERGERLFRFCNKNQLFVWNTFFKKKAQQKWTWSLDLKTKNEIDMILTPHKNFVRNVEVINKLEFSTDHRMVRATLSFKLNNRKFKQNSCARLFLNLNDKKAVEKFNQNLKIGISKEKRNYPTLMFDNFKN